MPGLNKRTDGQLWIDRKIPHGLKYHVDGETYQVQTTKIYKASSDIPTIHAGTVVTLESTSENAAGEDVLRIKPACFPKDTDAVLGVCSKTTNAGEELAILTSGLITLNESDIDSIFYQGDALSIEAYKADGYYKGAPVYWFIGRSYFDNGTPKYDDPYNKQGRITLCTPSGIKWKLGPLGSTVLTSDEQSLNVYYANLPVIGTLVDYTLNSEKTKFTEIKISLSVSGFESDIVWTWPFRGYYVLSPKNPPSGDPAIKTEIEIRHGLFPNIVNSSSDGVEAFHYRSFKPRCFCDILALDSEDDTEQRVFAGVDNYYGVTEQEPSSSDKKTVIEFKNVQHTKRLSVTGKVVYQFHYGTTNPS